MDDGVGSPEPLSPSPQSYSLGAQPQRQTLAPLTPDISPSPLLPIPLGPGFMGLTLGPALPLIRAPPWAPVLPPPLKAVRGGQGCFTANLDLLGTRVRAAPREGVTGAVDTTLLGGVLGTDSRRAQPAAKGRAGQ